MVIGWVLVCCCLPAWLCNNERIAVKQAKLQGKAMNKAVEIEDPGREPIEELNGQIVFLSGESHCEETLRDKFFSAVETTNCVKLRRVVEMMQWVETEHTDDGRVTGYSYNLTW